MKHMTSSFCHGFGKTGREIPPAGGITTDMHGKQLLRHFLHISGAYSSTE